MTMPELIKQINENWYEMAPTLYHYEHLAEQLKTKISEEIHAFYFQKRSPIVSQETFEAFTDAFSDILFIFGSREKALRHAPHAPTFAAIIDIKGLWSHQLSPDTKKPMGKI